MPTLTKRQEQILARIQKHPGAQTKELHAQFPDYSRLTLIRDLRALLAAGAIEKRGTGRATGYFENLKSPLLKAVTVGAYFRKDQDERTPAYPAFRFEIFSDLHDLFTAEELQRCEEQNRSFQNALKTFPPFLLKKEFERMTIELAWKSSKIEGNTYSLIDTEVLLKEKIEAKKHTHEEAQMLINHKTAFEYILDDPDDFKDLTLRKIRELHLLLVEGLGVPTGIRKRMVAILGANYSPIDNEFQIHEALEKMLKVIALTKHPIEKAFIALAMLAYIQAFEDGNKRTSRLVTNAILLAHDFCPLSFRSIEAVEYKKGVILLYEQNSAKYLKELFLEQFAFAAKNYFQN